MAELNRAKILEMLENGDISAEQAINLLNQSEQSVDVAETGKSSEAGHIGVNAMDPGPAAQPVQAESEVFTKTAPTDETHPPGAESPPVAAEVTPNPFRSRTEAWRRWWYYPFWGGVGVTLVGALLMYLAWDRSGFGFWFACTWFPFLFGVMVMALAWSSRLARWLHVRIHQPDGDGPRNISISFPLPLRLAAWFVRTFRVHIPKMDRTSLDELILALEHTNPDAPFYVEVQDGEDGERVEVYIG